MLDHFLQRIVPLVLTFAVSVLFTTELLSFLKPDVAPLPVQGQTSVEMKQTKFSRYEQGAGWGTSGGNGVAAERSEDKTVTTPYRITSQPRALYTHAARENNVQGGVRLEIVLLASGQIGSVKPVTELPYGLTQQAIAAARQIRFEPKLVNGVPINVVITREYTFTIY